MIKREQPLWESTRDLHHACEEHPLGQTMFKATVTDQDWCDWLGVFHVLHMAIDPWVPPHVQVTGALTLDLIEMLPLTPTPVEAAKRFAATLDTAEKIGGAAYVLIGAHRRGGQVMERRFAEAGRTLPLRHVRFHDPATAELFVKELRLRGELADTARATFQCLLDAMEEIHTRNSRG